MTKKCLKNVKRTSWFHSSWVDFTWVELISLELSWFHSSWVDFTRVELISLKLSCKNDNSTGCNSDLSSFRLDQRSDQHDANSSYSSISYKDQILVGKIDKYQIKGEIWGWTRSNNVKSGAWNQSPSNTKKRLRLEGLEWKWWKPTVFFVLIYGYQSDSAQRRLISNSKHIRS